MGLKIVVGGGFLAAPDWYENYRTFAIYCAVGRPPPESWNIAYILGSAQGITLPSAARTARKQRPVPSVAPRHLPAPRGVTPQGAPISPPYVCGGSPRGELSPKVTEGWFPAANLTRRVVPHAEPKNQPNNGHVHPKKFIPQ